MSDTSQNPDQTVDAAFIRRGLELADLNAVRVALYQQTQDPELAALPLALQMDDDQKAMLIDKATDWLVENHSTVMPEEPPADELRKLMNMATQEDMDDVDYEARRELPAFRPFPFMAEWPEGEKPEIPEDYRVVIVGSGFSGIAAGVQMGRLGIPFTVLERRPEPGGTWSVNRYPDIRVDTISITYEFSFEKEWRWSEYFGRGPEVRSYLEHVSKKFGVHDNTLFEHDLTKATWDEDRSIWVLEAATPDGTVTLEANVVIGAHGTFANARYPEFEGQEEFEGDTLHPSKWSDDFDATGRRIGVVGNGSTGVQLLSPIARVAEQVYVFQRTPQWISPRDKYGAPFEEEVVWLLDNFPGYWNWWRYMAIAALFGTHGFIQPDEEWKAQGGKVNAMNDALRETLTGYIKAQTNGDEELISKLVPDYAPFSRRPVVDNGWYKALTQDNVELVTDPIDHLDAKGVATADGSHYDIDALVTATGFHIIKYLSPAEYFGKDGVEIHDAWAKDGPRAYLSMMVPGYPNMFMLYGPNSQPLSGGTGLPIWYVVWSSYAAKCIMRMITEGTTQVEVTQEAYETYNEALDEEAAGLLLLQEEGAPDKNYYVNEFGRLQMNAPWYGPDFHRMCTVIDWDALEFR